MGGSCFRFSTLLVCLLAGFSAAEATEPTVYPPVYPDNGSGGKAFDWQAEWGTIHMNSLADGLNDPGIPASDTGTVPCAYGQICKVFPVAGPGGGKGAGLGGKWGGANDGSHSGGGGGGGGATSKGIANGIKFDIKNSLNNCVSKPVPNWAFNNPWDSNTTVCIERYGLHANYGDGHTLVYLPLWDVRSQDGRQWQTDQIVGCQQQIANNCVRDIHECIKQPVEDAPGYLHPVTHVFTPEEVQDLGGPGSQLPDTYFSYTKKLPGPGNQTRIALSATDPTDAPDRDKDKPVKAIQNGPHPVLARLKGYKVDMEEDDSKFIVMDPSDFYDLRHYAEGGKYDAGYSQIDKATGWVLTPDSCPVLGLKNGYSGICDPNGKAGCNLPIYGVGPKTSFTTKEKTYEFNDYPILWSGYAKKWAVISPEQYRKNVFKRKKVYLYDEEDVNSNPIFMLTRADDYCEPIERSSNVNAKVPKPDMPCIQYLQYQQVDADGTKLFVDLYNPVENAFEDEPPEYNSMQLYHLDEKGRPDPSKPVAGTGDNRYLLGQATGDGSKRWVSLYDDGTRGPASTYNNLKTGQLGLPAVYKADYSGEEPLFDKSGKRLSGPVRPVDGDGNELNKLVPGEYLGVDEKTGKVNTAKGAGLGLNQGTGVLLRVQGGELKVAGQDASCLIATFQPAAAGGDDDAAPKKMFIPTNSTQELQAFVDAALQPDSEIQAKVRSCGASYMSSNETIQVMSGGDPDIAKTITIPQSQYAAAGGGTSQIVPIPGGVKTWTGRLSCADLKERPACNQTKMISAQRFCKLENGSPDACGRCQASEDLDKDLNLSALSVGGEILVNPKASPSACYFSAACFNDNAPGCPAMGTSGGHVFCLAEDTKITMADGTEKAIKSIKAGEEVMSFNGRRTRNTKLEKSRVHATAITKEQEILKINGLKITPLHKVVLATGRAVAAKDLKIGDKIMNAAGLIETITRIEKGKKPITVYNLVLEAGGDGYIANGKRVISYPILQGMNGK